MVKKLTVLLVAISMLGLQASITLAAADMTEKEVGKVCSRVLQQRVEWFDLIQQFVDAGGDPSPMVNLYVACDEWQVAADKHQASPSIGTKVSLTSAKEVAMKEAQAIVNAIEASE